MKVDFKKRCKYLSGVGLINSNCWSMLTLNVPTWLSSGLISKFVWKLILILKMATLLVLVYNDVNTFIPFLQHMFCMILTPQMKVFKRVILLMSLIFHFKLVSVYQFSPLTTIHTTNKVYFFSLRNSFHLTLCKLPDQSVCFVDCWNLIT